MTAGGPVAQAARSRACGIPFGIRAHRPLPGPRVPEDARHCPEPPSPWYCSWARPCRRSPDVWCPPGRSVQCAGACLTLCAARSAGRGRAASPRAGACPEGLKWLLQAAALAGELGGWGALGDPSGVRVVPASPAVPTILTRPPGAAADPSQSVTRAAAPAPPACASGQVVDTGFLGPTSPSLPVHFVSERVTCNSCMLQSQPRVTLCLSPTHEPFPVSSEGSHASGCGPLAPHVAAHLTVAPVWQFAWGFCFYG